MEGYLYPLFCAQDFLVGQIELLRGLLATFMICGPFLLPFSFPFSYALLSTIDIYFYLLSCLSLRFFKGKHLSRARFRRYGGRSVSISCTEWIADGGTESPVFMFCAPEIVFGGTEGIGSRFQVLRARTHFRR
jgi:hypothetical protein